MDRSFNEIQQSILDAKAAAVSLNALEVLTTSEQTLNDATSTSKVSTWRLWVWIIAFAIWLLEKIVSTNAQNSRPHTIRWYREQCFAFLDGLELQWIDGQFIYNAIGVADIEDRKIIDRCAVIESNDGELVVKIAKDNAGSLEPLSAPELIRFDNYLNLIKDAGNRMRIINTEADKLRMTLNIYVDVSIIDLATGKLLNVDGDVYPVQDAVNSYLANLEFNGAFFKEYLKDTLKNADGVKLPLIQSIEWKFDEFDWAAFDEWKVPESGYFVIDEGDLTINYINYALANN